MIDWAAVAAVSLSQDGQDIAGQITNEGNGKHEAGLIDVVTAPGRPGKSGTK